MDYGFELSTAKKCRLIKMKNYIASRWQQFSIFRVFRKPEPECKIVEFCLKRFCQVRDDRLEGRHVRGLADVGHGSDVLVEDVASRVKNGQIGGKHLSQAFIGDIFHIGIVLFVIRFA